MSDWQEASLADLAEYINGRAIKPEECSTQQGIPVIRIKQINDPQSIEDRFCGDDLEEKNIARSGDLLFSWSATLKTIQWQGPTGAINQHIFKVLPKEGIDKTFLHYLIDQSIPALTEESHGSTMKHIKKSALSAFHLQIPPLPEQKKIAEILSGIDKTISQTSQRIEKHKTLLLAILEQIFDDLSEKSDFTPLGDCCKHILDFRGRTPAKLGMEWGGGTIRALSANNVRDGYIDFNRECYLGSESLYKNWMTRGDCERGDIVFTMEAPMGNVAIIPDDEKYILSQRVVLLSADRQQILPEFLYWFMRSSRFRSDCDNLATGTTAKGIKQANLITISVPIATIEEQVKAVQAPTSIERLISREEQILLQLNMIKQSLSADLLSGRKKVSV